MGTTNKFLHSLALRRDMTWNVNINHRIHNISLRLRRFAAHCIHVLETPTAKADPLNPGCLPLHITISNDLGEMGSRKGTHDLLGVKGKSDPEDWTEKMRAASSKVTPRILRSEIVEVANAKRACLGGGEKWENHQINSKDLSQGHGNGHRRQIESENMLT